MKILSFDIIGVGTFVPQKDNEFIEAFNDQVLFILDKLDKNYYCHPYKRMCDINGEFYYSNDKITCSKDDMALPFKNGKVHKYGFYNTNFNQGKVTADVLGRKIVKGQGTWFNKLYMFITIDYPRTPEGNEDLYNNWLKPLNSKGYIKNIIVE